MTSSPLSNPQVAHSSLYPFLPHPVQTPRHPLLPAPLATPPPVQIHQIQPGHRPRHQIRTLDPRSEDGKHPYEPPKGPQGGDRWLSGWHNLTRDACILTATIRTHQITADLRATRAGASIRVPNLNSWTRAEFEQLCLRRRPSLGDDKLDQRCVSSIVQINEANLIADVGLEPFFYQRL